MCDWVEITWNRGFTGWNIRQIAENMADIERQQWEHKQNPIVTNMPIKIPILSSTKLKYKKHTRYREFVY